MPTDTTTIDVNYVALLARLSLSTEEQQKFAGQLQNILQYVDKLKELDVAHIEPTAHAVPITNVVRKDVVKPSIPTELALRNAPQKANNLFIVPKIVE
jgi:aspartyl-tRNA(Asn)/glutamyl-tRNA(Gln) amidotransferase subunit C